MLLPRNAPAWRDRLVQWLEPFEREFGHVAQRGAFRRYLLGLLSDRRRKSMSAMLERVHDPGTYQPFQHVITHAPWTTARVWHQLRAVIPERTGMLILDATSFPKQGTQSVGVARKPGRAGTPSRLQLTDAASRPEAVGRLATQLPARAWRRIQWRNGTNRRRAGARLPSLPVARATITEILTAHFFVTHPHYLDTMLKLRDIQLRI